MLVEGESEMENAAIKLARKTLLAPCNSLSMASYIVTCTSTSKAQASFDQTSLCRLVRQAQRFLKSLQYSQDRTMMYYILSAHVLHNFEVKGA